MSSFAAKLFFQYAKIRTQLLLKAGNCIVSHQRLWQAPCAHLVLICGFLALSQLASKHTITQLAPLMPTPCHACSSSTTAPYSLSPRCVPHVFLVGCEGAKWHYAPMAQQLAQAGVLTCVIQYSLYPDALAPQMVDELSQALTWTFNNIGQHGGNPHQVTAVPALLAVPAVP